MQNVDPTGLEGKTILLDIDGTLSPSGVYAIDKESMDIVARLKERNEVYLLSNKRLPERNTHIAVSLRVPLIISPYRKPDPRVVRNISFKYPELVVIGDKVLTDGLLAFFLGARFIRVPRVVSPKEPAADIFFNALDDIARNFMGLVRLLRPQQWLKNFLVFAPLFFATHIYDDARALAATTAVFVAFCFLASAGYIINDFFDRDSDRTHPLKRRRPLASGEVAPGAALVSALFLVCGAGAFAWYYAPGAGEILAAYFLSSLAYSARLKQVPILEIFGFIWFYLARVIAGGIAAGVVLSSWLTLAVIFLALFLVSGKRYAESLAGRSRVVLQKYPPRFMEGMLFMSASLVVVFYGVYSVLGVSSPLAVYSTIPVVGAVMRYLQLTLQGEASEYPEKLVFKDRGLLVGVAVWLVFMLAIFY